MAITTIFLSIAVASTAAAAGWQIIKKTSTNLGRYGGSTTLAATVNHPHAIAVRLIHASADLTLQCQTGDNDTDWHTHYKAGFHPIRSVHDARKSACTISLDIAGSGHITGEILTR